MVNKINICAKAKKKKTLVFIDFNIYIYICYFTLSLLLLFFVLLLLSFALLQTHQKEGIVSRCMQLSGLLDNVVT